MALSKQFVNIISVGKQHQRKYQYHTDILCDLQDLFAHFAARKHLPEGKYHVSAIESGDRNDIHHRQDNRQERCHRPELVPIPLRREDIADSDKATHMLVQARIRFYDKHKLVPIVLDCLGGQSCARRDSLEEVVLLGAHLKEVLGNNAQLTLRIYRQSQRQGICATQNLNVGSCACQLRKSVSVVVAIFQPLRRPPCEVGRHNCRY